MLHQWKKKNDKESGYKQAFHLNFEINGIKSELIVYYTNKDAYKHEGHKLYEKTREGEQVSPEEIERSRILMQARDNIARIERDRLQTYKNRSQDLGRRNWRNEILKKQDELEANAMKYFLEAIKIASSINFK
jgi:hypothetical protein